MILNTWNNLLKHSIFTNLLVIEYYVQDVLQKEMLIAPFLYPQNNYNEKVQLQAFISNSN